MKQLLSCAIFLAAMLIAAPAGAQESLAISPARTLDARAELQAANWQVLEPGLSLLHGRSAGGIEFSAFQIDQSKLRFELAVQSVPDGERVEDFGRRANAVLAVNGGFFGEKEPGKGLFSVGLLRRNGKQFSPNWPIAGGYLLFGERGIKIARSAKSPPERQQAILQSKPLLIAPGGQWAMNTNQELSRPRTLVCELASRELILLVVFGSGMSLFEAGWLLRDESAGGYFGCNAALAMDGGGSTQLWVAGHGALAVKGETNVHNALVLVRR